MFRIGMMGCGVVADYGHIPAILKTEGLDLVALYDPVPGRAKSCADKFGIRLAFENSDEFFNEEMDAVVICSSATAHRENVLDAARHGLHVLCEKPLALEDADAEEMIQAMEAADRMLLVGFVYRFSHVAQQMKGWVREGIVGEVRSLRFVYLWDLHGQYEKDPNGKWIEAPRWAGRMNEGGPMIDCGVHMIDLARWWLDSEVVNSYGAGAWVANYEAPDHMFLHLDHERGEHTMIEMSFSYGHTSRYPRPIFTYDLIGTGGVLRYDRDGWALDARNGEVHQTVPGASEKDFPGMYLAFVQALEKGATTDFPNGRDGLVATQIARAATDQAMALRPKTLAFR